MDCNNNEMNEEIEFEFGEAVKRFFDALLFHINKCQECKKKRECFNRPENEIIVPEKIIVMGLLAPWMVAFGREIQQNLFRKFNLTEKEIACFATGLIPKSVEKPAIKVIKRKSPRGIN